MINDKCLCKLLRDNKGVDLKVCNVSLNELAADRIEDLGDKLDQVIDLLGTSDRAYLLQTWMDNEFLKRRNNGT